MQTQAIFAGPAELNGLYRKIQAWRQTRPGTRPMPEELWKEATSAAQTLGISRVSRALRVNSQGLKRRVIARGAGSPRVGSQMTEGARQGPEPAGRMDFIEMSGLSGFGAASPAASEGYEVVEMVAPDGTRLTIRLKTGSPNLVALVNIVRGRS